jgi:signal transduction histidine kinase
VGALTKDGSPDAVQVSIRDRGPGLSADERELIFEPFYRSDAHAETSTAARPKAPGSGLGLAICRGLVEAHGGRIWVECDNEAGASFHFTLPSPGDGARPRLLGDEPLPRGES